MCRHTTRNEVAIKWSKRWLGPGDVERERELSRLAPSARVPPWLWMRGTLALALACCRLVARSGVELSVEFSDEFTAVGGVSPDVPPCRGSRPRVRAGLGNATLPSECH